MNIYKRLGFCLSIFLFLGVAIYFGALLIIPNIVDLNKYKDSFAKEIERQSGFKISCEDISFKKSFTPYFKVQMHHCAILYPNDEIFLKIKDADLKIKIFPLLFKKIVIKDTKFIRPIINITLYEDFTNSLEKYFLDEKSINTNGFSFDSIITNTLCERYKFKIYDETTKKTFYLEGDELKILDLNFSEKASLILKGALFQEEKEYINYDINLKSYIGKSDNKLTMSPFKQILDYDVKGKINGNLEIAKNGNLIGSLSLTDFSLDVDNNLLNNNNANLTFKGQEVEIISSLHTSEEDEINVNGKFNFGKRKHIDLITKAKNIDIERLQKVLNILSQVLNIHNFYEDFKVKGLLNADFTVSSDFKKLNSTGNANIIDAEIMHKDLPYRINKINSLVNFDNNKITIEKAQAYVNSTPVNIEGTINEDMTIALNAYSDNLDISTLSKMFLKEASTPILFLGGKVSFLSDIKGKFDKDLAVDTKVIVSDLSAVEKEHKLPIRIKSINTNIKNVRNKYSGEIICNDLSTIFNKKKISSRLFKMSFDEKNIKVAPSEIKILDSIVIVSASMGDYLKKLTGYVDISGSLFAKDIAIILSDYIKQPYKAQGTIPINARLDLLQDEFKVSAKLKANKDNYLSYLVIKELLDKPSVLNVDMLIKDDNINVGDISLKEDVSSATESQFRLSGLIVNKKEPIFRNFKIRIPQAITASMNFLGGEEISLDGELLINNKISSPEIKGNINIQRYVIKKLYTLVKNANVNLQKDNIRIIAPEVDVNNSKFNILLDIEPKLSEVIKITNANVNSYNLDLNTLFSLIEKERNPFALTRLNIKKGIATINNFKVLDIKASDISADFTLRNNILKLDAISALAYNGKITGAVNYDFNYAQIDLNLIGKGLDIKTSLYDLCKIEDNLAGKTDFTSSVSMVSGDYNSVIKSLSGKVTFNATEGKMGTLGKFEYYMNAQNLLYHGLLNATLNRIVDAVKPDNTARFKTAEGSIFLQNGYIIAEEIKTCGQNMSLFIKGRYNILSNLANLDIYGRISNEIKSKLGSFADVSISEIVNGQPAKKSIVAIKAPSDLIDNIFLWNRESNENTNAFKVNVYGNINYPNSINSFSWVISDEKESEQLPEFSQIPQL